MRQKLFTKQIDDMLFKQYAMGNDLSKQKVVAKIFNPYGRGVWYLLNSDPSDPDYIWAIVDLFEIEVGSVSRESLEMMKVPPFGLNLERDIYFQPINASELLSRLNQGETFAKGGKVNGYKIYHDTLAQALEEVEDFFHNEGYLFTSDNYFPDVTVGGIGYGETARITRPIQLQGKSKEGVANIQIYRMDSGRYELNMYPSYANGGTTKKFKVDDVVYNKRTKTIGIVRLEDERGETKTDADGNVNTSELQHYNPMKYPNQKDGKVAPSTEKEINTRGLWNPFKEYADGGELQIIKNESGENYLANADSTPNEMAVKLANGGSIPNNYRGRTTEDIWNSLTEDQRIHFMFDHFNELGIKESEIVGIAKKEFQDLNEDVKGEFKVHTMMGQYADGGETFAKGGQVSGYFVFRPYKLEGNFYVNTTIQNEPPNSVIIKGLEGKLKGNDINSAEEIAHNIMQNHPEIAKLDIVKLGATTLKNKKVASFERNDDEYSYKIDYFANGGGVGFDQYGNPYGFDDEMDSVYEYHYKEEDKNNPYKVWDKMEGVYVAEFPSRQRAIEYIERNRYGYAKGGKIKNQYEGRTPEDIWNNLSKEQRSHFIYDHENEIELYRGEEYGELTGKEIIKAYNSDYKDLDKNIRNRFDNHTREGEYRLGGEIKVVEGDMIKSKNVKGKVYYASGTMFKLEDEYGNKNPKYFSTKDFKKSEIIKMAKGGKTTSEFPIVNIFMDADGQDGLEELYEYLEQEQGISVDNSKNYKKDKGTAQEFYTKDGEYLYLEFNKSDLKNVKKFEKKFDDLYFPEYEITYQYGQKMAHGGTTNEDEIKSIEDYELKTPKGKSIRKATKVIFTDGSEIKFTEKMTKAEAIKNALYQKNKMAKGGTTTFKDKVKSISQSLLKRKKVSPSVQKDYGKTYDKKEAIESAKRIAGAIRSKEMAKKKS